MPSQAAHDEAVASGSPGRHGRRDASKRSDAATSGVRVEVLGTLRARTGGGDLTGPALGSRKTRRLLVHLATVDGARVSTDSLIDHLWGPTPPTRADRVVASLVSRLRATLGRDAVIGDAAGYRLGPTVTVDLDEARGLLEEASARAHRLEPALALICSQRAEGLLAQPIREEGADDTARAEQTLLLRRARLAVARAELALDRPGAAAPPARRVLDEDPLDEEATRLLMQAFSASGESASALRVYAGLRRSLRYELGADPSPETTALHATVLALGSDPSASAETRPSSRRAVHPGRGLGRVPLGTDLVGREPESGQLHDLWNRTAAGHGGLVLITGEAGVGKTSLAASLVDLAAGTGGLVLAARCHAAERSLLLQPVAEALSAAVTSLPPETVRAAASGLVPELVRLVPSLAAATGADPPSAGVGGRRPAGRRAADVERRELLSAVASFLGSLAHHRPVLLFVDDLHEAGDLTVEALHYLHRAAAAGPLLVVTTARPTEGAAAIRLLSDVASRIRLGRLDEDAVAALAARSGFGDRAAEISRRTGGHALYVVEILRDLADGGEGRPQSLAESVVARVDGCGPSARSVLRSAAVIGNAFDPLIAARLSGESAPATLAACERALDAGLLIDHDGLYEFANDLIRDAVYASIPLASRVAQHRVAADLLADQPEVAAGHAASAGQWRRAALAWLLAAEAALERFAARDAEHLADHALAIATRIDDPELRGRALLVRGHGREARSDYEHSHEDFLEAVDAGRAATDLRLEMTALRAASGEVLVAVARSVEQIQRPLDRMLEIARRLGDRGAEADALARLTVLSSARLDFVAGGRTVDLAEAAAAASHDPVAQTNALDARKNLLAYQGIVAELGTVTRRLEPLQRRSGDLWSLQWTVFESSFEPLAAEDYPAALDRMGEALGINRRSGFEAIESWHLAHIGWVHRLAGDLDRALDAGARALGLAQHHGRHRWWLSAAAAFQAAHLLAVGRVEDARQILEPLRPTGPAVGDEGYRLRLLAPLALVTGSRSDLDAATELLTGLRAEPGNAWLLGADAYLCLARAWVAAGDPGRADRLLAPFLRAARHQGWPALVRLAGQVRSTEPTGLDGVAADGAQPTPATDLQHG